jgi:hypothetical protein
MARIATLMKFKMLIVVQKEREARNLDKGQN